FAGGHCGLREDALRPTRPDGNFPAGGHVAAADVSDAADRDRVVEETLGRFGRIDILVNNAGISGSAPLLELDVEAWRAVMETNVEALFFLAQAVLPTMREQGYGRIVNIASVYGTLALNSALYTR